MSRPLRIAYVGPAPRSLGGVAGMAGQVLPGLLDLGHEIDCYVARLEVPLPERLRDCPGFRLIDGQSGFRYGAWYSRTELTKLVSGQMSRAVSEHRLANLLTKTHARVPYDVVYQFSHVEIFGLTKRNPPALVVHPEVHAAGELRWLLRERELERRCEPTYRRLAARAILTGRSSVQRRHVRHAAGFICPSRAFQRTFCADCKVDPERTRVVANPVDLETFRPRANGPPPNGPVRIVFVGRISVRKGIECLVELSHRLADLEGSIRLEVIGDRTQWSNYRPLLSDLDPRVASYRGGVPPEEIPGMLASADLLVQPSKYEPFGHTVAEALASGVPVVATNEVGAAEGVSEECMSVVPVGDTIALEAAVRSFVEKLRSGNRSRISARARAEAERLFDPRSVARGIAEALEELAA